MTLAPTVTLADEIACIRRELAMRRRVYPNWVKAALDCFARFLRDHDARYFWSHGASFDGPILAAAYAALKRNPPWKFWDARDTRTLYDLAGVKPDRSIGVAHNAQVDAENQVYAVFEAYRKLGLAKAAEAV